MQDYSMPAEVVALCAIPSDPIPASERLIVALDVPTIDDAKKIVEQLKGDVNFYKIGMQLQFAGGLKYAEELVKDGKKVFLDSKLLDIPQTISSAVENVAKMGVTFLTVHGMIGKAIPAAIKGRRGSNLKILAVTVLTNLDQFDLDDLGINMSLEQMVIKQTKKALEAGADGVITSGLEASKIRELFGSQPTVVTPGIRPAGADIHDQRRVATPAAAIRAGADYLVVGRPILQATDPLGAVRKILREIESSASDRQQGVISTLPH
jgi:orotidine-5'-phosphate decarboxylase